MPIATALNGVAWPAVPLDAGAQLLAMQFQFERTQWWSAAQLAARQDRQLDLLLRHAADSVPFYQQHWSAAGIDLRRLASADFLRLPLLRRADVQKNFDTLTSRHLPPQHAPAQANQTSGSLGMPLRFLVTPPHQFFWDAITLRDHLWHGRDFAGKLASIRYNATTGSRPGWGGMLETALRTGPATALSIRSTTTEQIRWLISEAPTYLITYPSIIRALAQHCIEAQIALPTLREVRSFGEILPDDTRDLVRQAWNIPVTDMYSAQETGYLALQCPVAAGYHVMAENVRLEVLDDAGRPCQPGEVGRVVVTTLHNFAMPLIRYVIGDYAEVGPPCPCGRGLPHLTRIVGRERNLLRLANGGRIWPVIGTADWVGDIPIRQLRLVQREPGKLTFQYTMERPMTEAEQSVVRHALQSRLPEPFEINCEKCEILGTSPNGKYEEVLCLMDSA